MTTLKQLAPESVGRALREAGEYRLLGEPCEAASICEDVLAIDPDNHEAHVLLVLALTEQFRMDLGQMERARILAAALPDRYERAYYSGVVQERLAKAQLTRGGTGSDGYATSALKEAMAWYEQAERLRPVGNDDALLRWNTCARTLERWGLASRSEEPVRTPLMLE
jgi:tetratricopeptide (TPR) repeat protein